MGDDHRKKHGQEEGGQTQSKQQRRIDERRLLVGKTEKSHLDWVRWLLADTAHVLALDDVDVSIGTP